MRTFRGKVAVVTGAASGIGRALAVALAAEGAELALCDIDEERLAETAAQCRGARVTTDRVDVADRHAVYDFADRVVDAHGAAHLVINNAGVALAGPLRSTRYEDFEWLMGINFWGVVYGSLAFLPHIEQAGGGHIVNISSIFGIIAAPLNGSYNAAKFAVRGFSEALRMELELDKSPVAVTTVHPGGIKTNIARAARIGEHGPAADQIMSDFDRIARTSPERCARVILEGVRRNRRRVLVGADARLIDTVQRMAPTGYQHLTKRFVSRDWPKRT
jgi:short-subunit dehydrogenase